MRSLYRAQIALPLDKTSGCTFLAFLFCFCKLEMFQFYKMILEARIWQWEWHVRRTKAEKDLPGRRQVRPALAWRPAQHCLWFQACPRLPLGPGMGCRAPLPALPDVLVSPVGLWGAGVNAGEGPWVSRVEAEGSG